MALTEASIMIHVAMVMLGLWALSSLGCSHPFLFAVSLLYLYKVNGRYSIRVCRRIQFEERKDASQRRVRSDPESVRWLNLVVQRVWPICMEQIASNHLLLPIIPWFLQKYKPWTTKQAVLQQLYLGRNPPKFTGIRILREVTGDDDMVLELGLDFLSGEDMTAILAVQPRKRLAFGMWAKMHVTGMHVEGKVLVGLKFIPEWPFLKRVSVCFLEPPHFQMTVKPIFQHGLDVSELPGIAGWLDKILAVAFGQTLVEPNMLVVDVEKFASENPETWFTVDEKLPIAFVKLEILEAEDMQPSDLNGLADPYVKGQLGPYRFRTKIRKKTLTPKWHEEFKIPISSWEAPNVLVISVYDKDHLTDDDPLGDCIVQINSLRDGERHDKWLNLRNIKMGRLHLAITVLEEDNKKCSNRGSSSRDEEVSENAGTALPRSGNEVMHHNYTDVSTNWESSKGRNCDQETQLHKAGNEVRTTPRSAAGTGNFFNTDGGNKVPPRISVIRGLHKIGAMFSPRQQKVYGKSFSSDQGGSIGRGHRGGGGGGVQQRAYREGCNKSRQNKIGKTRCNLWFSCSI